MGLTSLTLTRGTEEASPLWVKLAT
jgi:hypothetical protein